jgi:hypothetical protein
MRAAVFVIVISLVLLPGSLARSQASSRRHVTEHGSPAAVNGLIAFSKDLEIYVMTAVGTRQHRLTRERAPDLVAERESRSV